jgi:hypothetical protein
MIYASIVHIVTLTLMAALGTVYASQENNDGVVSQSVENTTAPVDSMPTTDHSIETGNASSQIADLEVHQTTDGGSLLNGNTTISDRRGGESDGFQLVHGILIAQLVVMVLAVFLASKLSDGREDRRQQKLVSQVSELLSRELAHNYRLLIVLDHLDLDRPRQHGNHYPDIVNSYSMSEIRTIVTMVRSLKNRFYDVHINVLGRMDSASVEPIVQAYYRFDASKSSLGGDMDNRIEQANDHEVQYVVKSWVLTTLWITLDSIESALETTDVGRSYIVELLPMRGNGLGLIDDVERTIRSFTNTESL